MRAQPAWAKRTDVLLPVGYVNVTLTATHPLAPELSVTCAFGITVLGNFTLHIDTACMHAYTHQNTLQCMARTRGRVRCDVIASILTPFNDSPNTFPHPNDVFRFDAHLRTAQIPDGEPPIVQFCPRNHHHVLANADDEQHTQLSWTEPHFVDNINVTVVTKTRVIIALSAPQQPECHLTLN